MVIINRDEYNRVTMPYVNGVLIISVNPGRSEGRYLYEMPDVKIPA
jgi:hypothetical protein